MEFFLFTLLGFFIGLIGTLVGAGGGFLLMPVLLFLYPKESPEKLTSISLIMVFFNALSGTLAYEKKKRIDWKSVREFSLTAIPGAILGSIATAYIPRTIFDGAFGILLSIIAIYLLIKKPPAAGSNPHKNGRTLVEKNGTAHHIAYPVPLGLFISFIVGFISSLIGIGGGIIHVPAMVNMLHFPVHIATATSHAVLSITTLSGVLEHYFGGTITNTLWIPAALSLGVVFGAQVGAMLSDKIKARSILVVLALALFSVGMRLFLKAFIF